MAFARRVSAFLSSRGRKAGDERLNHCNADGRLEITSSPSDTLPSKMGSPKVREVPKVSVLEGVNCNHSTKNV